MARKTCNKGHIYDSAIYGSNCPFCPPEQGTAVNSYNFGENDTAGKLGGFTEVNQNPGGATVVMGDAGNATIIRPADESSGISPGKRIMGLFVSYDTISAGQVFHIYEGRNSIGRDATCDIKISNDRQVSGKHLSVLYRGADGKFRFKDEQSGNGTFLNDVLTDEGELKTFDVIRIGSTNLIFIAIPQIPKGDETKHRC